MKRIHLIIAGSLFCFFMITCKRDDVGSSQATTTNRPPIARAGKDTSILIRSCNSKGSIRLDAGASSDPENSPLTCTWQVLLAPGDSRFTIDNSKAPRPIISNMTAGRYDIELTVLDYGGLFARDTIVVNVISATANGYDLDITITGTLRFLDNNEDCYYCYPCCYYDISYTTNATGTFPQIGTFSFYAYEEADTVTSSTIHSTNLGLYSSINNMNVSVYGTSTINYKKIFQSGGGAFNGTFTPTNGSALDCDKDIFKTVTPLIINGSLDTAAHRITLTMNGKIYF